MEVAKHVICQMFYDRNAKWPTAISSDANYSTFSLKYGNYDSEREIKVVHTVLL